MFDLAKFVERLRDHFLNDHMPTRKTGPVSEQVAESQAVDLEDQPTGRLLDQPLLLAIKAFSPSSLKEGTLIFHGSREKDPYTDYANRRLYGTRKWVSQNACYAVSYAFTKNDPDLGLRLLWTCRVKKAIPSLIGSQFSLSKDSCFGSRFPWEFPNAFSDYARVVLETSGPVALLDLLDDDGVYKEILVSDPEVTVEVVDVTILPEEKAAAEALFSMPTG